MGVYYYFWAEYYLFLPSFMAHYFTVWVSRIILNVISSDQTENLKEIRDSKDKDKNFKAKSEKDKKKSKKDKKDKKKKQKHLRSSDSD